MSKACEMSPETMPEMINPTARPKIKAPAPSKMARIVARMFSVAWSAALAIWIFARRVVAIEPSEVEIEIMSGNFNHNGIHPGVSIEKIRWHKERCLPHRA
jgi:hypothetical protein